MNREINKSFYIFNKFFYFYLHIYYNNFVADYTRSIHRYIITDLMLFNKLSLSIKLLACRED